MYRKKEKAQCPLPVWSADAFSSPKVLAPVHPPTTFLFFASDQIFEMHRSETCGGTNKEHYVHHYLRCKKEDDDARSVSRALHLIESLIRKMHWYVVRRMGPKKRYGSMGTGMHRKKEQVKRWGIMQYTLSVKELRVEKNANGGTQVKRVGEQGAWRSAGGSNAPQVQRCLEYSPLCSLSR